jgi:predicted ferric reductase
MQQERRKNVRVRPAADYQIQVEYEEGLVKVQLSIMDMAVGGVGVLVDELFQHREVSSELKVKVTVPDAEPFETIAILRHSSGKVGGRSGFHFAYLTAEQQTTWGKAVSELLERGHSA